MNALSSALSAIESASGWASLIALKCSSATILATVAGALDAGVDPAIFGDFSEEGIAKGVAALVAASMANVDKLVEAEVSKRLAPLAEREAKSVAELHFKAINDAHPDADSIAESAELKAFIGAQPTFTRKAYETVLAQGTAQEVIELFDSFKAATGKTGRTTQTNDELRAKALAKVNAAEQAAPRSLSGIPGSVEAKDSPEDAFLKMDGGQMIDALLGMDPSKASALVSRML